LLFYDSLTYHGSPHLISNQGKICMKIVLYIVAALLVSTTKLGCMGALQKFFKQFAGPETIFEAAYNGDMQALGEFLNHIGINCKNKQGMTPLHIAALKGNLPVVKFLLQKGALVDCKDNDWLTPLHRAACRGHLPVVAFLIENKALVNCQNKDGFTPLHLACGQCHTDVVKYLIECGADSNMRDNTGFVPFFYANIKDHGPIIELFRATVREAGKSTPF
jgi:ankyrin repeat protein